MQADLPPSKMKEQGENKPKTKRTSPPPPKKKTHNTNTMKIFQINLHHSKAAMTVLCQQLAVGVSDVAFIQEPWICGGQRDLTSSGEKSFMLHQMVIQGPVFTSGTTLMPYLMLESLLGTQR
jgi:hypothetical protein